jgi:hypothetical protein
MKTFKILAILLIITLVNSAKKIATYEDIVLSLTQIKAEPSTVQLAKLNEISESFSDSNNLLGQYRSTIETNCGNLGKANLASLEAIQKKMTGINSEVARIKQSNNQTQININQNIKDQEEEEKKIAEARRNIDQATEEMKKKELQLVETLQVLKRLRSFAEDELVGTHNIKTAMTNYTVVSNNGVSFIQKANFKEDLHALMKKSETAGKALISTLLLIASSYEGRYSNQKQVRKILNLLNKIISQNDLRQRSLDREWHEETGNFRKIKKVSKELLQKLREEAVRDTFTVSLNHKTINMYEADIVYYTKALGRRQRGVAFQSELCAKHRELVNRHLKQYATVKDRISELKDNIA